MKISYVVSGQLLLSNCTYTILCHTMVSLWHMNSHTRTQDHMVMNAYMDASGTDTAVLVDHCEVCSPVEHLITAVFVNISTIVGLGGVHAL